MAILKNDGARATSSVSVQGNEYTPEDGYLQLPDELVDFVAPFGWRKASTAELEEFKESGQELKVFEER